MRHPFLSCCCRFLSASRLRLYPLLRLACPTHTPRIPAFVGACIMSGGMVRRLMCSTCCCVLPWCTDCLVQLVPVAESSERRRMGAAVYLA